MSGDEATAGGIERRTFGIGGAALSALVAGPPDGEVVVLLHGIPSSAELWRDVIAHLAAAGLRAVAFDLPGYGRTLVPARADHSLAGAAELVATWIRVEVTGTVWLAGHDLGGGVAQILASRHPTLLDRLTLIDTVFDADWPVAPVRALQRIAPLYPALAAARLVPNAWTWRQLRLGFARASRLTEADGHRVFWDGKVTDADGRRAFVRHLQALDPSETSAALGNLSRLSVPVQLIWGDGDRFLPWEDTGRRLAGVLTDPAVTVLDDVGHFAPLEAPDRVAAAMLAGGAGDPR